MLVYPKEDSVIIADTVADEGIAACRPGSQYVPLGQLKKASCPDLPAAERIKIPAPVKSSRSVSSYPARSGAFHFLNPPLQFFQRGSSNGDEKIHVIEIFVVGKSLLQKISGADGRIQIVIISVGIGRIL